MKNKEGEEKRGQKGSGVAVTSGGLIFLAVCVFPERGKHEEMV